jgi:hypothetical protein
MVEQILNLHTQNLTNILDSPSGLRLTDLRSVDLNTHRDWFTKLLSQAEELQDFLRVDIRQGVESMRHK